MRPGQEHEVYVERVSTLSGEPCDRCHAVPAELYAVGCEQGCFGFDRSRDDEGAWRYCGGCARHAMAAHELSA